MDTKFHASNMLGKRIENSGSSAHDNNTKHDSIMIKIPDPDLILFMHVFAPVTYRPRTTDKHATDLCFKSPEP